MRVHCVTTANMPRRECPITAVDFESYLSSDDAQSAAPWELQMLSAMRQAIGRGLSDAQYATLRAQISNEIAQPSNGAKNRH